LYTYWAAIALLLGCYWATIALLLGCYCATIGLLLVYYYWLNAFTSYACPIFFGLFQEQRQIHYLTLGKYKWIIDIWTIKVNP